MSSLFQQHIIQKVSEAKYKIQICLPKLSDFDLLNQLITKLQQGLSVDIIFSEIAQTDFDSNMEVFYRVLSYKKLGGEFYKLEPEQFAENSVLSNEFCLIDAVSLLYGQQNSVLFEQEKRLANTIDWNCPVRSYTQYFADLRQEAESHATSQDELELELEVDSVAVSLGDSVHVSWVTNNAETLEINQSIGQTVHEGVKLLPIRQDIWLLAKAVNDKQKKHKAVFVRALEVPDIQYKIFAYDHRLKEFLQVMPPNEFPHHYGITREQPIRIEWEVQHAEKVIVADRVYEESEGSSTFMVNEHTEISIIGIFGETERRKDIFVKVFPTPNIQHIHIPLPYGMKLNANIDLKGDNFPKIDLPKNITHRIPESIPRINELSQKVFAHRVFNKPDFQQKMGVLGEKRYSLLNDVRAFLKRQRKKR